MLDLLLIGSHSLSDESGRVAAAVQRCGLNAGGIAFVSSQDTRTATELIEHRTAMKGYRVECMMHFADDKPRLAALLREGVGYLAMTTRYFRNLYEFCDIIQFTRSISPTTRIILGGGFFRSAWSKLEAGEREHLLEMIQADYYLCHDACQELVRQIVEAGGDPDRLGLIPDLIWRKEGGGYRVNPSAQLRPSELSPLAWEDNPDLIYEITSLKTAVSCPFSCSFCAVKNKTDAYHTLPLGVIRQNIERLMGLGRTKILHFTDETINLPRKRFVEFLKMLIELDSGFSWYSFCRCEYIDEETASLMKQSGCLAVLLGLETGNNGLLARMNKQVSAERLLETHRIYQQAGIATFGFFIVGFPGETRESVEDTVRFIEECRPDFYRLHPWECEVGTPIWETESKRGLILKNGVWSHPTMHLRQAKEHIERMQQRITGSVSIDKADFSFALQLLHHGVSLDAVKGLYRSLNSADSTPNAMGCADGHAPGDGDGLPT